MDPLLYGCRLAFDYGNIVWAGNSAKVKAEWLWFDLNVYNIIAHTMTNFSRIL